MNDDMLQRLWKEGRKEPEMSKAQIEALLKPRFRRQGISLKGGVWVYVGALVVILVAEGMNIYGVRANPGLLAAQIVVTLATAGFLAFGVHLLSEVSVLNRADEALATMVRRRLRFLSRSYEAWLWMIAISILFATFAAVVMRHNQDGMGGIDRGFDLVDASVAVAQVLVAYAILKIAHLPFLRESRALLSDLESQVTTGTDRFEANRFVRRRWFVALVVLGLAALIVLAFRAMGYFG